MNRDECAYLYHHGVKGMKWGRRKQRVSSSSRKRVGLISSIKKKQAAKKKEKLAKKREAARLEKNKAADKRSIKSMTDAELNKYVLRLQKEKQARDLKYDSLSTGRKIVQKAAQDSATRILTTASYQVGMHLVGKSVNKAFGADVINTAKKKDKKEKKAA